MSIIPPTLLIRPGLGTDHEPQSLRIGHPSTFADQPAADPEVPGYMLAPRVVPGARERHRARCLLIGCPQLIGGPEPEVPGYMLAPLVVRGMRRLKFNNARTTKIAQMMIEFVRRYATARGRYRIYGAAEYRFYRSNTGPPQPGDSVWATSASLPNTPADTFADGTWWVSVSYFNGLVDSGFLPLDASGRTWWRLEISGGVEGAGRPAGAMTAAVAARAGGVVRITALYYEAGSARADQWAIGYSLVGADPPADTPDVTAALPATGLAVLDYELPAAADGATVKVRVQTRRNDGTDVSPVWVYSTGESILSVTADAGDPEVPGIEEIE